MIPPATHILGHVLAYFNVFLLWSAIITFAITAGADFGAGIWDLLAFGKSGEHQRELLQGAIGPIWEANEVWSIFLTTGLFTAFPVVFSTLSIALFYPFAITLLGLVFRGAAFEYTKFFRKMVQLPPGIESWGRMFGVVSLIAPFILGASAAAVSSGDIRYINGHVVADYWRTWVSPYALSCGFFGVGACAVLAASYMTVQLQRKQEWEILQLFRWRALIAGAFTAAFGAASAVLSSRWAPYIWHNLTTRALAFAIAAVVIGVFAAITLYLRLYKISRMLVVGMVVLILGAWGIAQFPYFIVPDLTIEGTASPPQIQLAVTATALTGLGVIVPAFIWLIYLFQGPSRTPKTTAEDWALSDAPGFDLIAVLGGSERAEEREQEPGQKAVTMAQEAVAHPTEMAQRRFKGAAEQRRTEATQRSRRALVEIIGALALTAGNSLWQWRRQRTDQQRARKRIS